MGLIDVFMEGVPEGPPTEYAFRVDAAIWNCKVNIWCARYEILKRTPCGYWVADEIMKPRFVNNEWYKKYAYLTVEEATESFIARKRRAIAIWKGKVKDAEEMLSAAEKVKFDPNSPFEEHFEFKVSPIPLTFNFD